MVDLEFNTSSHAHSGLSPKPMVFPYFTLLGHSLALAHMTFVNITEPIKTFVNITELFQGAIMEEEQG